MTISEARQQTRILVQTAAAVCEDKKGEDTRILELDPVDSGLSDFFLITSATNERQATAIADEIELRIKREFGIYPSSVEGRNVGEWILLDYFDFVVHVFQAEKRAFYDIERLRKSARPLTPAEFDAELKADLSKKTLAVRSKAPVEAAPGKKIVAKKSAPIRGTVAVEPATKKASKAAPVARKAVPAKKTVVAKKAVGKAVAGPLKKAAPLKKVVPAKKLATKKAGKTLPVAKRTAAKPLGKGTAPAKKIPVAKKVIGKVAVGTAKKTPPVKKSAPAKKLATKKTGKALPVTKPATPAKKAFGKVIAKPTKKAAPIKNAIPANKGVARKPGKAVQKKVPAKKAPRTKAAIKAVTTKKTATQKVTRTAATKRSAKKTTLRASDTKKASKKTAAVQRPKR